MFANGTLVRLVEAAEDSCEAFKECAKTRRVFRVVATREDEARFYTADGKDAGNGHLYWTCDEPWTRHKWALAVINSQEDMEALYG